MTEIFTGTPSTIDARSRAFIGLHPELCFVAAWPDRKPGYWTLGAKELEHGVQAHRLTALLLLGRLQGLDMALHRCGNASCHNPFHIYVGGEPENRRDKELHRASGRASGPLGLIYPTGSGHVLMPQPAALSAEASRLATSFAGFTPGRCHHSSWLLPTHDGYRQLCDSTMSGEVVGAHRKIYTLFNGPLDRYDIVSHACGDKTCLNPFHLYISGRQASKRDFNVKHDKRCKISTHALSVIADFKRSATEVAKELGVHRNTVVDYRATLLRG